MNDPELIPQLEDGSLRPASGCERPVIWIERVLLLDSPESKTPIREVKLRRGLNIIWAPAGGAGMGGHAAGKTTFCRLLRYVLGEPSFGTDDAEAQIRGKFIDGGVAAEVHVGDYRWAVWRPFFKSSRSKAARDVGLDALADGVLTAHGFTEYEAALEEMTVKRLSVRSLARVSRAIFWRDMLGWLARDQECRFRGLTTWREAESDSDGFRSAVEDRHELMRAVLDLISTTEHEELAKNHNLLRDQKTNRGESTQQSATAARLSERLVRAHGLVPDEKRQMLRMQLDVVRQKFQRQLADLESEFAQFTAPPAAKDDDGYTTAVRECAQASHRLELAASSLNAYIRQRQSLGGAKDDELERLEDEGSAPPRYCGQLLKVGADAGCPLALAAFNDGKVVDFEQAKQGMTDDERRAHLDAVIASGRNEVAQLRTEHDAANKQQRELREQRQKAQEQRESAQRIYERTKAQIEARIQRAADLDSEWTELDAIDTAGTQLETKAEESRGWQTRYQEQQRPEVFRLSQAFSRLIQEVLHGDDAVSGECKLSGRELVLTATGRNDLTSAAILTVKVVVFDLACIVDSANGRAFHPRFLIHDSPREADLAVDIYHRLFEAAQRLEAPYPDDEAAFQYIVTTTEPPPEKFKKTPWLVIDPPLEASVKERRLFKEDL